MKALGWSSCRIRVQASAESHLASWELFLGQMGLWVMAPVPRGHEF